MIEVRGLCKEFERSRKAERTAGKAKKQRVKKETFLAVDHVSIEACEGEIIGILGPNGAGKRLAICLATRSYIPVFPCANTCSF